MGAAFDCNLSGGLDLEIGIDLINQSQQEDNLIFQSKPFCIKFH